MILFFLVISFISFLSNNSLKSLLHCEFNRVPSVVHNEIIMELAKEISEYTDSVYWASQIYSNFSQKQLVKLIETASDMKSFYEDRVAKIASLLAKSKDTNITAEAIFTAKYEIHRVEHWVRIMELVGLDVSKTLKAAVSLPWDKTKQWIAVDKKEKEKLVLHVIKRDLC